jgi:uncharacterized protein YeaO (DUF488 family)
MSERLTGISRKAIDEPIEDSDGYRLLTVSRLTKNDGKTPDPIFDSEPWDYWDKRLANNGWLVGAWYRGEVTRAEFDKYYRLYLALPKQQEALQELIAFAKETKVTVLCVCHLNSPEDYCHTLTLLEICGEMS